jgi:hypothetical protein
VALEDAGASGKEIGCGDSIIPVDLNVEPTAAPLTAALEELLAIDERFYGQSGLYNNGQPLDEILSVSDTRAQILT